MERNFSACGKRKTNISPPRQLFRNVHNRGIIFHFPCICLSIGKALRVSVLAGKGMTAYSEKTHPCNYYFCEETPNELDSLNSVN